MQGLHDRTIAYAKAKTGQSAGRLGLVQWHDEAQLNDPFICLARSMHEQTTYLEYV
jgi:hypothetical protein